MRVTTSILILAMLNGVRRWSATPWTLGVDISRPGAGDLDPLTAAPDVRRTPETLAEKAARFDELASAGTSPTARTCFFSDEAAGRRRQRSTRSSSATNVAPGRRSTPRRQALPLRGHPQPEALDNLRRIIRGEHAMLRDITGVRGLFTRAFFNPPCPASPRPRSSPARTRLRSVGGALQALQRGHLGPVDGVVVQERRLQGRVRAHMFLHGVGLEIVERPRHPRAASPTSSPPSATHGGQQAALVTSTHASPRSRDARLLHERLPRLHALLSLSWVRLAAVVGGRSNRTSTTPACSSATGSRLHPRRGPGPLHRAPAADGPRARLQDQLEQPPTMAQLAMYGLLRHENDPALLAEYRRILLTELWDTGDRFPMRLQENSLYTFFYLVNRDPATRGPPTRPAPRSAPSRPSRPPRRTTRWTPSRRTPKSAATAATTP